VWSFVVSFLSCVAWWCSCRVFVCVTCFFSYRNRRTGRGHGALCAVQHLGVVGEPGGSGRGECVRGAITNLVQSPPQPPTRPRWYHAHRHGPQGEHRGYVCLYLSLYLCIYVCINVSMYLCIYVSVRPVTHPSIYL